MPAVQLARLRIQIARLGETFVDPPAFRQGLESLLELYGDRTFHPGEEIKATGLTLSFNVPPLVMRQLEMELSRLSEAAIQSNSEIIDGIWQSDYLEMRQIAIFLLGRIARNDPKTYLLTVKKWCQPSEDLDLLAELLQKSGEKIRAREPQDWLDLVESWCKQKNTRVQEIGLIALEPFLAEQGLDYLPQVFNLIEPLLMETHPALQKRLLVICQLLNSISPVETHAFFKHLIEAQASSNFIRLMRRLIPSFSNEDQAKFRRLLPKTIPTVRNSE